MYDVCKVPQETHLRKQQQLACHGSAPFGPDRTRTGQRSEVRCTNTLILNESPVNQDEHVRVYLSLTSVFPAV